MVASAETEMPPEEAVLKAMERAGLTREMFGQMVESPHWAGTIARFCQQYLYVTHLPKIVAAQISKASLGDTAAAKHLAELFGKSDMDKLDEQTKALAEADPVTRIRATEALIEDLQRAVAEAKGAGSNPEAVAAARAKAIASANERKPSSR